MRVLAECVEWDPEEWFLALTNTLIDGLQEVARLPVEEKHCDSILANLNTLSAIIQFCDDLPISRGGVSRAK